MNVDRLELRRIALATMIMVTSVVHRSCSRGLTHARAKHAPLENENSVLEHMALKSHGPDCPSKDYLIRKIKANKCGNRFIRQQNYVEFLSI